MSKDRRLLAPLDLNNSGPFGDFLKSAARYDRSIPYGRLSPRDPFRRQGPARSRTGRRRGRKRDDSWNNDLDVPVAWRPGPPQPDVWNMNQKAFQIPIRFDAQRRAEIRELDLYVSHDQGQTWNMEGKATPEKEFFPYTAKEDGPYWFTVAIIDQKGRQEPVNILTAPVGQRIMVDTVKPEIELNANRQGDEIRVSWRITEAASQPLDAAAGIRRDGGWAVDFAADHAWADGRNQVLEPVGRGGARFRCKTWRRIWARRSSRLPPRGGRELYVPGAAYCTSAADSFGRGSPPSSPAMAMPPAPSPVVRRRRCSAAVAPPGPMNEPTWTPRPAEPAPGPNAPLAAAPSCLLDPWPDERYPQLRSRWTAGKSSAAPRSPSAPAGKRQPDGRLFSAQGASPNAVYPGQDAPARCAAECLHCKWSIRDKSSWNSTWNNFGPSGLGGVDVYVTTDDGATWQVMHLDAGATVLPPVDAGAGIGARFGDGAVW